MTEHPHVALALSYARDVVERRISVCRWVWLACDRALRDRDRSDRNDPSFPYYFDPDKAEHNCAFAECFAHVKGKWRGLPYRLEPWQCFRRCEIFGWMRNDSHMRRFREVYMEVPRKNGKSLEEALDGLYCFAADDEPGAECYSGATTEKQAWEVFRPARLMADANDDFKEMFGVAVNAKSLAAVGTASRFEPLIGKPGDGASPSWACADEYHEHETDDFVDTMRTGMMAREQPLMEKVTTAGDNIAGPCYAAREEAQKVLEGVIVNDQLWCMIYTLDPDDDWTTEAALRKANPNYGVSVNPEILKAAQLEAISNQRKQGVFQTKHLDIWVSARNAWMNMEEWNRCADTSMKLEDAIGLPCWVGLDMAAKVAFSTAAFLFVEQRGGAKHYRLFGRHYLPEQTAKDPAKQHYLAWVLQEHIKVTSGSEIDFELVQTELGELCKKVHAQELDFDPRHGTQVSQAIEAISGVPRVELPQTVDTFSPAMYEIEAAVKSRRLRHNGDPVMTWFFSNVVAKPNAREALYPRSSRPGVNHIDGAVATFFATCRALAGPALVEQSVYEQRGLLVLG